VAILEALARTGPCTPADLVRETGLPRPTAHRLAVALEEHALVVRDRGGRFRLGGRLVGWGAAAGTGLALVEPARAVLERLSTETGESAQLYVREGDQRVCVATHERPTGLRDTVALGAMMPLTKGSGGRVLLAWAGDRDRFDVDARVLEAVRAAGWAATVGEREPGVASVSAPVRVGGEVVAAISVSGPAERLGPDPGSRFADPVVAAAVDLARARGAPVTPP
jgi:DNA-binding IclR family transcriptional regulator